MLVDAGTRVDYARFVAPALERQRRDGTPISLICVCDAGLDHTGGLNELLNDELAWKVLDDQLDRTAPPASRRPPDLGSIWFNVLGDHLLDEDALATLASWRLPLSMDRTRTDLAARIDSVIERHPATSQLNRRAQLLGIPSNASFDGMTAHGSGAPVRFGPLRVTIVNPSIDEAVLAPCCVAMGLPSGSPVGLLRGRCSTPFAGSMR